MNKLVLGTAVAAALAAAGLGLAGVATAAPADPSPSSSAPASADAAPVPAPLVYQPVDASDGFYGVPRGSVPTASTQDLSQVPILNRLPGIGITPLPARDTADAQATDEQATDGSTADGTDGANGSAAAPSDSGTDASTPATDQ